MKRIFVVAVTTLLCLNALSAMAWELSMNGEYEIRFRYYGRLDTDNDLFGNMRLQDRGGPMMGFAGPNIYGKGFGSGTPANNAGGVRIVRGGFSESDSDAHLRDQRVSLRPVIRVNKAVSFHTLITIGGYRNKYDQSATGVGLPPFERYYVERTSRNAYDTAAIPSVEQWKTVIHVPWGVFSLGIKDFPFGVGATLGENTRASAVVLVVPYGPFRFLGSVWLGRTRFTEGWSTGPDGAEKNTYHVSPAITYTNGPLEIGALELWRMYHANAWEADQAFGIPAPLDDLTNIGMIYAKYNNGRFFANAEFAYLNIDRRRLGAAPTFFMCRHFFAELGTVVGPTKLTFVGAGTTGQGRNCNNATRGCVPMAINHQAMEPYEWLMFNTYAGGNNAGWTALSIPLTSDEHGQMADAFGFGARLDYAVAANLNVWGSYLWAHRTEQNGFFAGGMASDGSPGNATPAAAQAWKTLNGFGLNPNPYVDDGFIGWEVNAGVDWKILENTTFNFRYAYWQPGEWFDQAYQAVTIRDGAVVTDGLLVGRAPINAFEGKLMVSF
jgi:opacity protein-like surface antigen